MPKKPTKPGKSTVKGSATSKKVAQTVASRKRPALKKKY